MSSLSSPMRSVPAVSIHNLNFAYSAKDPVLQNVNLEIAPDDFVGILGPNGGGKTTLLQLILGLLKPTCGEISIYGLPPHKARAHIGYVPQFSTMNRDFPATALEVVLMGGSRRTKTRGACWDTGKDSRNKACALLHKVGLQGLEKAQINELSGGQRQRALIARALMGKPDDERTPYMLVLDEPTANIDPQGKFCFYDFLHAMRKNVCMLVVSHDLALNSKLFSSVVLVNRVVQNLSGLESSQASLKNFFGYHNVDCPVNNLLHSALRASAISTAPDQTPAKGR